MQLPEASLSTTSLSTYHRPWQPFRIFCSDRLHFQGPIFRISTEHLALFIAFLAENVCCFNSFNLHFSIKLSPSLDLTKIDMIQLALRGYSKHSTPNLIASTWNKSSLLVTTHSHQCTVGKWYMYTMSFFAVPRVGEITCRTTQPRGM